MTDIVERLRRATWHSTTYETGADGVRWEIGQPRSSVPNEAADTIEQMREAMRQVVLALHEAGHAPKHGQHIADAIRAALAAAPTAQQEPKP